MLGETNPLSSKPGSIRGDFAIDIGRNVCHGSDSVESANKEIALWFKPEELVNWNINDNSWIYEWKIKKNKIYKYILKITKNTVNKFLFVLEIVNVFLF